MRPERSSGRTLRFLTWLSLLGGALFVVLQLPPVKSGLRLAAERFINANPDLRIQMGKLSGVLPFSVRAASLKLGDARGIWLETGDVEAHLDVFALLEGRIRLKRVSARGVTLKRAPDYPPSSEPASGFPVSVRIDAFSLSDLDIVPARLQIDDAAGEFGWNFHSSAMNLEASLSGRRAGSSSDRASWPTVSFHLQARLQGQVAHPEGEVNLQASDVEAGDVGATGVTATLHLERRSASAGGKGQGFDLVAAVEGLRGMASGSAHLRAGGDVDLLRNRLHSRLRVQWTPPAGSAPSGEATLELTDEALRIAGLHIHDRGVDARGQLDYALSKGLLEGRLSAKLADLSRFSSVVEKPLAGSVDLAVVARGSLQDLGVEVSLTGSDMVVGGSPILQGQAKLALSGLPHDGKGSGRVTVTGGKGSTARARFRLANVCPAGFMLPALELTAPGSSLEGSVTFRSSDRVWMGNGKLKSTDLAGLDEFSGLSLAGSMEVDAAVRRGENGLEARLDGKARDLRLATDSSVLGAGSIDVHTRLKGEGDGRRLKARIKAGDLRLPAGVVQNFEAEADGELAGLAIRAHAAGNYLQPFSVRMAGTASAVRTRAGVEVGTLTGSLGGETFELQRRLSLRLEDDGLRIDHLDLRLAGGNLSADLVKTPESLSARFDFRGLPLTLLGLYDTRLAWQGRVGGRMSISGSASEPRVDFEADGSGLRSVSARAQGGSAMGFHIEGRRQGEDARLGLIVRQGTGKRLELSSSTEAASRLFAGDANTPLTLRIVGDADVAALWTLVGESAGALGGDFHSDLRMHGSLAQPRFAGTARLQSGGYEDSRFGVRLDGLSASLHGEGSDLVLDSLGAEDAHGGHVRASGRGDFRDGVRAPRYRLKVTTTQFRAVGSDDRSAVVSGAVTLQGRGASATVTGSLGVDRADITLPERFPPEVAVLEVEEKNLDKSEHRRPAPSPRWTAALDLDLKAPGRVFVRSQDVDSEWKGSLHLGGSADKPLPSGDLHVVRGTIALLGLTFRVRSGVVGFDGRTEVDPLLDIVAETTRNSVTAVVTIRGRSSDPKFLLDSEPPMPRDEIVSQLLFGTSSGGLSATQGIQLAQALAALSGRSRGGDWMQRFRKTLGADVLEVAGDESGGQSLRVGKYLRKGVYLSVDQGLSEQGSTATVQVELVPNLRVETEVGADQRNSVELNWSWNY